jgi:hypothetical protein
VARRVPGSTRLPFSNFGLRKAVKYSVRGSQTGFPKQPKILLPAKDVALNSRLKIVESVFCVLIVALPASLSSRSPLFCLKVINLFDKRFRK